MKRPKYGGRVKGTPNKRTVERTEALARFQKTLAEHLGSDYFEGDALALMQSVYKNMTLPIDLRLDAAKCASHFERPRLQAVAMSNCDDRLVVNIVDFSKRGSAFPDEIPSARPLALEQTES